MKKLIFLLLFSVFGLQAQTYQNPTFGTIKTKTPPAIVSPLFVPTIETDGTLGKASVNVLPLSTATIDALKLKSYLSTGLLKNGLISINADPTKFNISAGIGIISNFDDPENPTSAIVNFPAFTGITPTYLLTGNITYIAINSMPAIVMQATPFTAIQRRDLIELGAVIHSNLTNINVVNNISAPSNAIGNQLHDFIEAVGALNLTGNKYSANGANLLLDKSAGSIFKMGVNFAVDWKNPHQLSQSAVTGLTFRYRTQNGTEGSDVTSVNPALYDLSNVLTAVPNNKFSIQTVVMFQTGLTRILYGQNVYDDLATAKNAIFTRSFNMELNAKENGIVRAYIVVKNNATSLQTGVDCEIIEAQKFGGVSSGGVALTLANIVAALGYTPANDLDVIHKTGDEVKTGSLETSKNFIVNRNPVNFGGMMTQTAGVSRWYTHTDNTAETGSNIGSDYVIRGYDDSGIGLTEAVRIKRADNLFTHFGEVNWKLSSDIFSINLNTIATNSGQPFFQSNKGYYVFKPSVSTIVPRFYLMPNGTATGTASKFEMFTTDYLSDSANYSGLNVITNATNNDIQFGSNRLGTGSRLKMVFGGDYVGSALQSTSSRLEFFTDNSIGLNAAGGAVTFGANATDPFSFSLANQYTFKNPTLNQATRVNIVGNGTSAGILTYGTESIRNANGYIITGTSNYGIALNPTNTGTGVTDYFRLFGATGNLLLQNGGTFTDNGIDRLQVNGTILASAATTANQVVIKSQLDAAVAPYKSYTITLSQGGTSAPTIVDTFQNTLSGAIVWARTGVGVYTGTLTGAFTANKTFFQHSNSASTGASPNYYILQRTSANIVTLQSSVGSTPTDGIINAMSIEIRVYL